MSSVDEILDAAFERPRRLLGRVGDRVMATCDASTERTMIKLAAPGPQDDVLVLESGAGVALREAAQRARSVTTADASAETVGDTEHAGTPGTERLTENCVDVVLSVNGMHRWNDRTAVFTELNRILRPEGRLLLSVHERWAGASTAELAALVRAAGFVDVQAWRWHGPFGTIAVQLRARSGKRDGGDPAQRDHRADDPSAGV